MVSSPFECRTRVAAGQRGYGRSSGTTPECLQGRRGRGRPASGPGLPASGPVAREARGPARRTRCRRRPRKVDRRESVPPLWYSKRHDFDDGHSVYSPRKQTQPLFPDGVPHSGRRQTPTPVPGALIALPWFTALVLTLLSGARPVGAAPTDLEPPAELLVQVYPTPLPLPAITVRDERD